MKKIFMLAGEPSGDAHGSYLVKQLKAKDPTLSIRGWGGNKMRSSGVEILRSLEHLAFMGFTEVAKNFATVLTNFSLCKKQITQFEPDLIVFIDYPGFNLRMAKWARRKGYKTMQYIAEQTKQFSRVAFCDACPLFLPIASITRYLWGT